MSRISSKLRVQETPARQLVQGSPKMVPCSWEMTIMPRQPEHQQCPACQEGSRSTPLSPCSTHNRNHLAGTFLSYLILISSFSLAWESVGDSHISKNFTFAFKNAAWHIPHYLHSVRKHTHGQHFLKSLCSREKWTLLHMPSFLSMNFDFSASISTY